MFLTKKALRKINLLTGAYFILSAVLFILSLIYTLLDLKCTFLVILGFISFIGGLICIKSGRYSEGKGKLIGKGYRLVHHDLRPAEFIRLYEEKRDDPENVISAPDFDILSMLAIAYDSLGDEERCLETTNKLIDIAPEKKKAEAKLLKCSLLYNMEKTEEADLIFAEVQKEDLPLPLKGLSEILIKSDRAMAYGDYLMAEKYFKDRISAKFPHNTPLSKLYTHINLAKIYIKTDRPDEAKAHIDYCIQNGGETAIPRDAEKMLSSERPVTDK